MNLQTVSQVSKSFGISAQMLRYYERRGLIKSLRKDDYAYRVYDEENIKRLQQIIILRKLQIPVKKISVILDNPDAATAIEIFKANISELQVEINALSTIKSALEILVTKIEELAVVRLNLNLLTDDSVMKLAESLSLIQKNVKENKTMEELNRASETLNKARQNLVRIVYRPTETVAKMWCEGCDPPDENAKNIMESFIQDKDLMKRKPDFKVFSHGVGGEPGSWFYVTIPEDLDVSAPFVKAPFEGGLWAVVTVTHENNDGWAIIDEWKNDDYVWDPGVRPRHEVYFNPLNISNKKNTDLFNTVFNHEYLDIYVPIKEPDQLSDVQREKWNEVIIKTKNSLLQNKPVEIDLMTMVRKGELDLKYENGLLEIKADGYWNGMLTSQRFKLPLKIELRAKTNDAYIVIGYARGSIVLNNRQLENSLTIWPVEGGEWKVHNYKIDNIKCGEIPVNEFVDIDWILDRRTMTVIVNGKIRYQGDDEGYIAIFKENPEYNLSSEILVGTFLGSTVTVESLRVTEIRRY